MTDKVYVHCLHKYCSGVGVSADGNATGGGLGQDPPWTRPA